jgi:hypothetical protein
MFNKPTSRVFVPGEPLQPSLTFVGKAGAYPREPPLRIGPALLKKNIIPGRKGLVETNT